MSDALDYYLIRPNATEILGMDFVKQLAAGETITGATVTMQLLPSSTGVDANPNSHVSGTATITGSKVSQAISNCIDGCYYAIIFWITTSLGQSFPLEGRIRCVAVS
jgi:sporulation-control protein spo0M